MTDGNLTNTWDYDNRLSQSVVGANTVNYTYDSSGQRIKYSASQGSSESVELLSSPWNLAGNNGDDQAYQGVPADILNGKESITVTYDLHGICAIGGDASAIIFDQTDWRFVSLSDYGQNCLDGEQTVTIPLSDFPGLNTSANLTGSFHTRFWYSSAFTVDILSAKLNGAGASGGTTTVYPSKYYNTDSTTPTKHVFAGDQLIGTIKGTGASAVAYSVATDHLTGSNIVTNSSGAVEELMDYYPYGEVRLDEKNGTYSEQRKFGGHEYDGETGLSYMNARYYNGDTGRFASLDSAYLAVGNDEELQAKTNLVLQAYLSDPQAMNSYSYARNNPLVVIDKTGNYIETAFDMAMFSLSARDFREKPSFWNGVSVIADGASLFLPIPAVVGAIRHGDEAAKFLRGINRADNAVDAARGVVRIPNGSNLRFSQTTVNTVFDSEGFFKGATRDSVIQGLKNGTINPSSIEVNYLKRDGYRIIENNRSASVLMEAGIPESKWNLQLVKPNTAAARRINQHLQNNNLPSTGIDIIKYKK